LESRKQSFVLFSIRARFIWATKLHDEGDAGSRKLKELQFNWEVRGMREEKSTGKGLLLWEDQTKKTD